MENMIDLNAGFENFHFINYIKIIDLSILNLLDYSDIVSDIEIYDENSNKIIVNFNSENKKLLEGFVINNINNEIYYGKTNVIINTCNPMKNWRQYLRKHALRANKYVVMDDSVYIDEIKLNNFSNTLFEKLPKKKAVLTKKINFNSESSISISLNKKLKFLEFDDVDIFDAHIILKELISPIGNLSMGEMNYNIIKDGNCEYNHNYIISEDIKDNVRLQLIEKGII